MATQTQGMLKTKQRLKRQSIEILFSSNERLCASYVLIRNHVEQKYFREILYVRIKKVYLIIERNKPNLILFLMIQVQVTSN
jgi:hypothetical protein